MDVHRCPLWAMCRVSKAVLKWNMKDITALEPCTVLSLFSSSCVAEGRRLHVLPLELLWSSQTDSCTVSETDTCGCSRWLCRQRGPSLVCEQVTRQSDWVAAPVASAVPTINNEQTQLNQHTDMSQLTAGAEFPRQMCHSRHVQESDHHWLLSTNIWKHTCSPSHFETTAHLWHLRLICAVYKFTYLLTYHGRQHQPDACCDILWWSGESVALLVAHRTNNQPTIGRLRVRGLLK